MAASAGIPLLQPCDRLTRDEFERRYAAMPQCKKAELVEGVVYMPSPVSHSRHGGPHFRLAGCLHAYVAATPGVVGFDNATVRLDLDNELQPDLLLRIGSESGGRCHLDPGGYLQGPPELVAEVTASSASYDLHDKLGAYRRNGVPEYLVWRVDDDAVDWLVLRSGRYEPLPPGGDGVLRSTVFPGLWLEVQALLRGEQPALFAALARGLAGAEHAAFAARLRA